MHPNEIHLCVAIVKYKTNLKRPRYGVCTRWLAGLEAGKSPECSYHRLGDTSWYCKREYARSSYRRTLYLCRSRNGSRANESHD
jgi:sulfite reductase alpha subunit-like flavoprotein